MQTACHDTASDRRCNALTLNALQKATFRIAKGGLLEGHWRPFSFQKAANGVNAAPPLLRYTSRRAVGMAGFYGVNGHPFHPCRLFSGVHGVAFYAHAGGLGRGCRLRICHKEVGAGGVRSEAWAGRSP